MKDNVRRLVRVFSVSREVSLFLNIMIVGALLTGCTLRAPPTGLSPAHAVGAVQGAAGPGHTTVGPDGILPNGLFGDTGGEET